MLTRIGTYLLAIALAVPSPCVCDELRLKDGDRVVLLGNGFIGGEREFGFLEARLTRHQPKANVVFRNLGWPGDTILGLARTPGFQNPTGLDRLLKEVRELQPTVLIIGYGLNESFDGPDGLPRFRKEYDALLAKLAPLNARTVLLSPPPQEDLGKPWPDPREHNQHVEQYTEAIADLARDRKLLFVDVFRPMVEAKRTNASRRFTTNGIQLQRDGYVELARIIERSLVGKSLPEQIAIDAKGTVAPADVCTLENVELSAKGLKFHLRENIWPVPGDVRKMQVTGLKPGKYALAIDGRDVGSFTETALAAGISLDAGAMPLRAGEELCSAIVRKNDFFYRRWRPYNDHSRHWGFIGGDFQLWEKQVAEQEKVIAGLRFPRPYAVNVLLEERKP